MTAFAITNQPNLRYWTISAAIVVLVHGAIAAAVLSWRNATAPMERPGPVVIDLGRATFDARSPGGHRD